MTSCIDIDVIRLGAPMLIASSRIDEKMHIASERADRSIEFRCGLVCSTNSRFYIDIPMEHIWLIPENDFSEDVVIYSNVSWTIE